jgi:hypothetical protein
VVMHWTTGPFRRRGRFKVRSRRSRASRSAFVYNLPSRLVADVRGLAGSPGFESHFEVLLRRSGIVGGTGAPIVTAWPTRAPIEQQPRTEKEGNDAQRGEHTPNVIPRGLRAKVRRQSR